MSIAVAAIPPPIRAFAVKARHVDHPGGRRFVVPRQAPPLVATWRPTRWRLGLPCLADLEDAQRWLAGVPSGCEVVYHVGCSLAATREQDRRLDALARFLLCHAKQRWHVQTEAPCGHIRAVVTSAGNLELKQRRCGPTHWCYLAVRR